MPIRISAQLVTCLCKEPQKGLAAMLWLSDPEGEDDRHLTQQPLAWEADSLLAVRTLWSNLGAEVQPCPSTFVMEQRSQSAEREWSSHTRRRNSRDTRRPMRELRSIRVKRACEKQEATSTSVPERGSTCPFMSVREARPQSGPFLRQHGCVEGFSDAGSWKNPKKHRPMADGHPWQCGHTLLLASSEKTSYLAHGSSWPVAQQREWLGLLKVGSRKHSLPDTQQICGRAILPLSELHGVTDKKPSCHKTVWTFLPPEHIYYQQL